MRRLRVGRNGPRSVSHLATTLWNWSRTLGYFGSWVLGYSVIRSSEHPRPPAVRSPMELRHLKYFVAVAEEQNVTRAAARLHVSQPPLGRQIRDLEDELGVALFDHGAKSVRLTEAGRVFLTEARAVVQRADEAVQTVKAVASGQRGEIHVGYAPSLTVELLPRTLRYVQEANPGVRVQLPVLYTQEIISG